MLFKRLVLASILIEQSWRDCHCTEEIRVWNVRGQVARTESWNKGFTQATVKNTQLRRQALPCEILLMKTVGYRYGKNSFLKSLLTRGKLGVKVMRDSTVFVLTVWVAFGDRMRGSRKSGNAVSYQGGAASGKCTPGH